VTIVGLMGVTVIPANSAGLTVSVVLPLIWVLGSRASMVVSPTSVAVASPAASMTAVPGAAEVQVTTPVRSWVVSSENRPVAVNCWVSPLGTVGFVGVTPMLTSSAGVTSTPAAPWMLEAGSVAVTVARPTVWASARPRLPCRLLTDRVSTLEEDHCTWEVTSRVVALA